MKIYEQKLLKRVNAGKNPKILNQTHSTFENAPLLKWITDGDIDTMIYKDMPCQIGFAHGRTQKNRKRNMHNLEMKNRMHVVDKLTGNRLFIKKENFNIEKYDKFKPDFNSNRIWINNNVGESKIIDKNIEIPPGWVRGNPGRSKSTWFYDPITKINYQIKKDETPSENLIKGRYYPWKWFHNDDLRKNILVIPGTESDGYFPGRKYY